MCACNVWGISTTQDPPNHCWQVASNMFFSVHSNNIHLVKTGICEAEIKRNLTPDIKVSFYGAQIVEGRERGESQEEGREGDEDLEPEGDWGEQT